MRDAALLKEKAQLFFLNAKPAGKKLFFKKFFGREHKSRSPHFQKNPTTPTKPREELHFRQSCVSRVRHFLAFHIKFFNLFKGTQELNLSG